MKRLLYLLIVSGLITPLSYGQSKVKLGPEVGATYVNMYQLIEGTTYTTDFQAGARIGGVVDIELGSSKFYIQPGLSFMFNNGTKSKYEEYFETYVNLPSSIHDIREYHVMTLTAPVYFVFKTGNYYESPHFMIGVGGYVGANVGGRFKQDYTTVLNGDRRTAHYDRPVYIGYVRTDDDIAIWDAGVSAMLGYEFLNGFFLRGYGSYGLMNQAPAQRKGDNMFRNIGGGISIGFLFNTKPGQTWGWK